jgi:hypothetical protein
MAQKMYAFAHTRQKMQLCGEMDNGGLHIYQTHMPETWNAMANHVPVLIELTLYFVVDY